ncbi:efflux RND transporter permease subunit [Desulfosporosinus sp. OT]|uniref:efflux RND transporter permease subunit n=1 Tax=Desulfosporosinus sp. OT TaxID=913865 RepID=UPI0002239ED7|nr:efflux RND transporter permease subunit [Desulfosporosinus sp. OT]EGW37255.1 acrB/AcrD/AcrF family protein [Desulfosporosinus sp. OT]
MMHINLTEWALKRKSLVYYFMLVTLIAGVFSYIRMGRMEDPDFVIRQMVVSTAWPGASAKEVEEQVTDKIEKKLQDLPGLDYLRSNSKPGQAVIYVTLKDSVPEKDIHQSWLDARNMVNDMKATLPQGVLGPSFDDKFDDVYGTIYALTGDGYKYEEMRARAENIRRTLLGVESVKKVELIGVQDEKIYIELNSSKLAQLGIDPNIVINTVKTQEAMIPAGMVETSSDNIYLRVTGTPDSVETIRQIPIRVADRTFRLGDIANVKLSYIDPMDPQMYFNGQPAIGITVSMDKGGNILTLGKNLDKTIQEVRSQLSVGLELNQVANQSKVVENSIADFVESLAEAIVIVLVVCFISLGVRSGGVVALCIPLVIAGVFVCMNMAGIDLHKVSLGALIIALGLLVDDAIIAIEMMTVKLEQGWDRFRAASFAYTETSLPMLTGTLITCAGFIPTEFSQGSASEYTHTIFEVVTIALLISWVVSVFVAPLLGYNLIKIKHSSDELHDPETHDHEKNDPYNKKFYHFFRKILTWFLTHRKLVLAITILCFVGSVYMLKFVKQEFFPPSTRPELIVEMTLPEGTSIQATQAEANRFAQKIKDDPNIENYSYYVGKGASRFVLNVDPVLPASNYAQFVIVAKNLEARDTLTEKVDTIFAKDFANVHGHTQVLQTGTPSPYPVMLRVSGTDDDKVREIAGKAQLVMLKDPNLKNVNLDWNEKNKVMEVTIDPDKIKALGIDRQSLAASLQMQISGATIAEYREEDRTVGIVFRLDPQERNNLAEINNLNVHIGNGEYVSLNQVASVSFEAESGSIWRRNLKPTITIQASTANGITGNDATTRVYDNLKFMRNSLPVGYSIDIGGSTETSKTTLEYLMQPVPVMIVIIITLLMFQLQRMSLMFLTLLTAPMGIIGVSLGMLITKRPMGFVAEVGILALSGMIIRNSVILIVQIEKQTDAGKTPWDAIIDSAVMRLRPIMLTALAAILGMVPLMKSNFWGPMAVAISGGLFGATVLTLLVLPTMYAAWFKVMPKEITYVGETTSIKL